MVQGSPENRVLDSITGSSLNEEMKQKLFVLQVDQSGAQVSAAGSTSGADKVGKSIRVVVTSGRAEEVIWGHRSDVRECFF